MRLVKISAEDEEQNRDLMQIDRSRIHSNVWAGFFPMYRMARIVVFRILAGLDDFIVPGRQSGAQAAE